MSTPAHDSKVLLTNLASVTGRNVAIFLQELHYVTRSQHKPLWRGSYQYWQRKHFPFWSAITTERTIKQAEALGLVYSCFEPGKGSSATKHTKSYGINYEMVAATKNQIGTLLLDDNPLCFSSAVAKLFAAAPNLTLNDAFVLFEIRYWMTAEQKKYGAYKSKKNTFDGSFWDVKRLADFQKRLPFMSRSTIERSIKRLREAGYIRTEVTRLRTLAFTIVADKVNAIEGIASDLKVPVPPPLGKMKTKFYKDERALRGNDLYYIVNAFQGICDDQGKKHNDSSLGLLHDDSPAEKAISNKNLSVASDITRMVGKHRLMELLREAEPRDITCLLNGDWSRMYLRAIEWNFHAVTCKDCGEEYDGREQCACEETSEAELSYAT